MYVEENSDTKTHWNHFETILKHHRNTNNAQKSQRKCFLLNLLSITSSTVICDRYIPVQTIYLRWYEMTSEKFVNVLYVFPGKM